MSLKREWDNCPGGLVLYGFSFLDPTFHEYSPWLYSIGRFSSYRVLFDLGFYSIFGAGTTPKKTQARAFDWHMIKHNDDVLIVVDPRGFFSCLLHTLFLSRDPLEKYIFGAMCPSTCQIIYQTCSVDSDIVC